MPKVIEGQLNAAGLRIAVVAARFNNFISEHLISGAVDAVLRHGGNQKDITIVRVPGSLEIPLVVKKLAETADLDAIVAVGAVIRGATTHYEIVCNETARALAKLQLEHSLPIGFGVITADNIEQAIERAGSKAGNKGAEAALAAIEMVHVLRELS